MNTALIRDLVQRQEVEIKTGPFGTQLKASEYVNEGTPVLNVRNLGFSTVNTEKLEMVGNETLERLSAHKLHTGDIVFGRKGAVERHAYISENEDGWLQGSDCIRLRVKSNNINARYLSYYFLTPQHRAFMISMCSHGTTMASLNQKIIEMISVPLPERRTQDQIVSILRSFDEKIKNNRKINDNLQQQVMTLYRQMFIENTNAARRVCRADEYFDISIGKTPPRKEPQWFSENPADCVWVSISDMGSCGLFIANSSEYLTHEAVEKFNVKVVPDNTVLLSFKLTVGRIAITDGKITTNEAIAHFKTNKPEINEYLFCYLKDFNYQTMGSTSSIATAVNSKIIKGMPFVVPTDSELEAFHGFAGPVFAMIKSNQRENDRLATLRDTLLPKLMSGEIDVSDIQL